MRRGQVHSLWICLLCGLVTLAILAFVLISTAFADSDTIRPTDLCDAGGLFNTGAGNAWDDSLTTYTNNTGKLNNHDITFGEASACLDVDAWDALAFGGTYDSAVFWSKYEIGSCSNDTTTIVVEDSTGAVQATFQTATVGPISATINSWTVSGYLSDLTDLRLGVDIAKTSGGDTCEIRVFEVWIDGEYTPAGGGRRRFISMQ